MARAARAGDPKPGCGGVMFVLTRSLARRPVIQKAPDLASETA